MSFMDEFEHLKIRLKDIKMATNNFGDKRIGTGGFGDVYKGELFLRKGRKMVAFKRLDRNHGQGDVEFLKEIVMLSGLKHKNLVSLLHFCNEDNERILVYKYASRRSLDVYLGDASLTWIQRLLICLGAACGIAYLHDPKKSQQRVLHRDIKSSNILLNDKLTPKVSDFGLSKTGPANQLRTYVVSNAVGTPGYCDPSYFETGILSKECDVYSFGVVLFEVMCGRLCCEFDKGKFICILVHMWKKCYKENRLDDIIFPDLKEQIDQESLLTFAAIANRCLNRDPKKRPSMVEIIKELEVALHHQLNFNQHKANVTKIPVSYKSMEEFSHLKIPLEDIKLATNNFSINNLMGRGGFGPEYRGVLSLGDGQRMVCIKRLDRRLGQGNIEFWKEIMMLSKYKHDNIVSLLHFCDEGDERILVYKYSSRGSLDQHLSDKSLTWAQRIHICLDVAKGIDYLHGSMTEVRVLHRNIKSANILLDCTWTPKVSDFGLSKVILANEPATYVFSDDVVGTPGYYDPSYLETGILSTKSDVYSFGVVLFEVLCGRLNFKYIKDEQINMFLPKWRRCYDEKRLDEIILPYLKEQMDLSSLDTYADIAIQCLRKTHRKRPTMSEVIKKLEIALEQQKRYSEMMMIEDIERPPTSSTSQNQLHMCSPKGVLVGDSKTWLSKLKNGNVVELISAIKCIFADSLQHDSIESSRFSNVLRGAMYNGFTVKVRTRFLSTKVRYTVSLVFKHNCTGLGTHIPFKIRFHTERDYSASCISHVREDGWLMIELCQFTSCKSEHDFEIEFLPLFTMTSSSTEYFLEGIEFRPIEYVN